MLFSALFGLRQSGCGGVVGVMVVVVVVVAVLVDKISAIGGFGWKSGSKRKQTGNQSLVNEVHTQLMVFSNSENHSICD